MQAHLIAGNLFHCHLYWLGFQGDRYIRYIAEGLRANALPSGLIQYM